jgi:hypothetical protein
MDGAQVLVTVFRSAMGVVVMYRSLMKRNAVLQMVFRAEFLGQ